MSSDESTLAVGFSMLGVSSSDQISKNQVVRQISTTAGALVTFRKLFHQFLEGMISAQGFQPQIEAAKQSWERTFRWTVEYNSVLNELAYLPMYLTQLKKGLDAYEEDLEDGGIDTNTRMDPKRVLDNFQLQKVHNSVEKLALMDFDAVEEAISQMRTAMSKQFEGSTLHAFLVKSDEVTKLYSNARNELNKLEKEKAILLGRVEKYSELVRSHEAAKNDAETVQSKAAFSAEQYKSYILEQIRKEQTIIDSGPTRHVTRRDFFIFSSRSEHDDYTAVNQAQNKKKLYEDQLESFNRPQLPNQEVTSAIQIAAAKLSEAKDNFTQNTALLSTCCESIQREMRIVADFKMEMDKCQTDIVTESEKCSGESKIPPKAIVKAARVGCAFAENNADMASFQKKGTQTMISFLKTLANDLDDITDAKTLKRQKERVAKILQCIENLENPNENYMPISWLSSGAASRFNLEEVRPETNCLVMLE